MKNTLKKILSGAVLMAISSIAMADSIPTLAERVNVSANVLREISQIPDGEIPRKLMDKATCIATIPNVIKAGFIFGGQYGQGLVSCRVAAGWSRPSFLTIVGGSWGFQIGVESVDLVLVFTKAEAAMKMSKGKFTLGGDISIAAGPVGREAQASTDLTLSSEIYSYSRSRGLFAGLTLAGSVISIDHEANVLVYGSNLSDTELLERNTAYVLMPAMVRPYTNALLNYAH